MKPIERKCKEYCKEYPCNKRECGKGLWINNNGEYEMIDADRYQKIRLKERKQRWYEPMETKVNLDVFNRTKLNIR